MKRAKTKKISIFMIVLLMFMQSTPLSDLSYATSVSTNTFEVEVEKTPKEDQATVTIKPQNYNYDGIKVLLPSGAMYDHSLTSEVNLHNTTYDYDENSHSLTVTENKENEFNFVLTNLEAEEYSMMIQGISEKEIVVEEIHEFTIQQQESANSEGEDNQAKLSESEKNAAEESKKNPSENAPKETDKNETNEELVDQKKSSNMDDNDSPNQIEPTADEENEELGDLNTFLGIGPVFENALSGADADFRLTLKLTGAKRTYKNVNVVVDLPLTEYVTFDNSVENLDRLAIDGVSPTFNDETNELTYHFEEIKRGQMYEKIISLQTTNGYIPNNTSLEVNASITGDIHYTENDENEEAQKGDVVPFEYDDKGSMDINASGAISLSKYRVDESENEYGDASIVARGEEILWKLELEIPKKERGQLFLNPGEKITITDILPPQLEYMEVISGGEPKTVDNENIIWEFDVDDFDTQKEKDKTLFTKDIVLKTKVNDEATEGEVINAAEASATFINDNQVIDHARRGVLVAVDNPDTGEIVGNITRPSHFGPDPSANNGLGNNDLKNPNPTVTDDEILKFSHGIAPLLESFPDGTNKPAKNFKEFQVLYEIDEHLNLESLQAPGPFRYRPNNNYSPDEYFEEQPRYDIKAKINGGNFQILVAADQVIPGKTYTREELGLTSDQKVNEIKFEFLKGYKGNTDEAAPGGIQSKTRIVYEFTIDQGYRGTIENAFNVIGVNGNNERFNDREKNPDAHDNSKDTDVSGPRQATVVGYGENPEPVGRVGVKLLEDVRGVVTLGKNRMQVELENVNNSGAPMNSQLETVVLLPTGVTLHDEVNPSYKNASGELTDGASYEVVEDDYNGSGRQLVKVKWNDGRITKGKKVLAELDVYISDQAPSQLIFDIYGFSGDEGLQAPSNTEGGVTDTILQTDIEDLNGNGDTEQPRLKSGNIYSLAGKYDIQTEKLIKGPNDDDYSKFTTARFGETVEYKLKMTNTTGKELSIMTLIDVLPTVGDLGITDNVSRGSQFDPILEGPITLPADWQGKVNVYYSTAKNPERDDLTRHTDYLPNTPQLTNPEGAEEPNWILESEVDDWSTIHSFKIELQKGDTWINGQDIEIDFTMIMPTEDNVDDTAKNLDLVPYQRAAWNSFAVATDTGQAVEPERVGVALELDPPETPDIEKEVEDNNGDYGKDLVEKEREKDYNYRVHAVVPEDLRGYEYITLADELDEKLEVIGAVALVDGEEVDYEVSIEDQLVTLQVDREQLDAIAGQQLTLLITAQIKADVEVEVIDNEATIQVNDNPTKDSNKVPVIPPPPKTPAINKDVEGQEHLDIERDKEYKYNVITTLPNNIHHYEEFVITDDVDKGLIVLAEKVTATVDGEAYDGLNVTVDGNLITVEVTDFAGLKGKRQIELVITAMIHPDTNIADYADNKIPNTADLDFINQSGERGKITTDPVTVTTPPVTPEDSGKELPKTATQMFNIMLIGTVLLIIGLGSLLIKRRMKQ